MPTVIWGLGTPPTAATYAGETGDIFVNTLTLVQHRFALTPRAWTAFSPPTTTIIDNLLSGGQLNDRVAKTGPSPWQLGYRNAADGVVRQIDQTAPAREWDLLHQLGFQFVDVSVYSPGANNPAAAQTVIIPDIEFVSVMRCVLHFATPRAGSAIIRR